MTNFKSIVLVLLFVAILFNIFVFSPNNIDGAVSPILSVILLIGIIAINYWVFFTKSGKKYAKEYNQKMAKVIIQLSPEEENLTNKKIREIFIGLGIICIIFVIANLAKPKPIPNQITKTLTFINRAYSLSTGSDNCIYVSRLNYAWLEANKSNADIFKESIKKQTGKNCVIIE
jgi:hypothetical protein